MTNDNETQIPAAQSDRCKWFLTRIGSIIYRNNYCTCQICQHIYEHGITISDHAHALYCYEMEGAHNADGSPLQYFDTREEMLQFEKENADQIQKAKDTQTRKFDLDT